MKHEATFCPAETPVGSLKRHWFWLFITTLHSLGVPINTGMHETYTLQAIGVLGAANCWKNLLSQQPSHLLILLVPAGQMEELLARCLFLFSLILVLSWLTGHLCVVLSCSLLEPAQKCMLCLVARKEQAAAFSQNPEKLETDEKSKQDNLERTARPIESLEIWLSIWIMRHRFQSLPSVTSVSKSRPNGFSYILNLWSHSHISDFTSLLLRHQRKHTTSCLQQII